MCRPRVAAALGLLIVLSAGVVASAEEPQSQPASPDAEVKQLFDQLSDADFKKREAARNGLIDRGEEVTPQLEGLAKTSTDPETRAAVEAILAGIHDRRLTGPSLITLDVENALPSEVFEAVAKQARTELRPWPEDLWKQLGKKTVTLKVKREPFWAVMKQLLPQLELQLTDRGPGTGLQIMRGDPEMLGPSSMSGPFMVVAAGANESRVIRYNRPNDPSTVNTNINLTVYTEPRLQLLAREYAPTIEKFVDDAGHSLAVFPGRAVRTFNPHSRESVFRMSIGVPNVKDRGKRVGTLKGSLRAILQTQSEKIEIPDILSAKGATQSKGGWKLVVDEIGGGGENYSLGVTIFLDPPENRQPEVAGDWRRNLSVVNLQLLDAEGRGLARQGYNMNGNGQKWEGKFQFSRRNDLSVGEPVKLVWEFATDGQEVQIPFEFKDLPLP